MDDDEADALDMKRPGTPGGMMAVSRVTLRAARVSECGHLRAVFVGVCLYLQRK